MVDRCAKWHICKLAKWEAPLLAIKGKYLGLEMGKMQIDDDDDACSVRLAIGDCCCDKVFILCGDSRLLAR